MQKSELIKQIRDYQPFDQQEGIAQQAILLFLEKNDQAFVRENLAGHMVGGALLMHQSHDQILLTHHHSLGKWLQFGGHADGETDLFQVAQRETSEESGFAPEYLFPITTEIFDLDAHPIPANPARDEPAHWHYELRFLLETDQTNYITSDESDQLKWFSLSELEKVFVGSGQKRMLTKLQKFLQNS